MGYTYLSDIGSPPEGAIRKAKTIWLAMIGLLSFATACFIQVISRSSMSQFKYDIYYDSPLILICGACLFIAINRIDYSNLNQKVLSVATFISKASLAIFFMHVIIQLPLAPVLLSLQIILPAKLGLMFITSMTLSAGLSFILSKNKYLARYVLLMKG